MDCYPFYYIYIVEIVYVSILFLEKPIARSSNKSMRGCDHSKQFHSRGFLSNNCGHWFVCTNTKLRLVYQHPYQRNAWL